METTTDYLDALSAIRQAVIRCCASQIETERTLVFRECVTDEIRSVLIRADDQLTQARETLASAERMLWTKTIERESANREAAQNGGDA